MLAAQEGAASPQEIDESVKKMGFPMGPLTLNDMVGIDVGVHSFPIMHEAYGERFPVPLLFERLYKAERLGAKSGKGIYADGEVDDEFFGIIKEIQNDTGVRNTEFSAERLILRQVNEAIYCVQEKIATAEDIDRALVLGTGFPIDEKGVGGPLHWADDHGLDRVLEKLNHFKDTLGPRFWPHFLLVSFFLFVGLVTFMVILSLMTKKPPAEKALPSIRESNIRQGYSTKFAWSLWTVLAVIMIALYLFFN